MAEEKKPCSFRDTNSGRPVHGLLLHSTYENCLLSPAQIYLQLGTILYVHRRDGTVFKHVTPTKQCRITSQTAVK